MDLDKLQFINNELDHIEVRAESVMHMANVRNVLAQVIREVMAQKANEQKDEQEGQKDE